MMASCEQDMLQTELELEDAQDALSAFEQQLAPPMKIRDTSGVLKVKTEGNPLTTSMLAKLESLQQWVKAAQQRLDRMNSP